MGDNGRNGSRTVVHSDEELREHLNAEEIAALDGLRALDAELTSKYTDRYLIRFTFARKLDPARALELLRNHEQFRLKYHAEQFSMERIEKFLDANITVFHPHLRTRDGHPITFVRAASFPDIPKDPRTGGMDLQGYMMFVMWWLDVMYTYGGLDSYRKGVVVLEDFAGANMLAMMTGVKQSDMKEIMSQVQDHVPGRFSALRLFNAPWWIRLLMNIVMPFMKKKLRKKFSLIQAADIAKFVDPKLIPSDLGGKGTSFAEITRQLREMHRSLQDGNGDISV